MYSRIFFFLVIVCAVNASVLTASVFDDDAEAGATANHIFKCRDNVCNVVCHIFKNSSGACVDGRCNCTKSVFAEDDTEAVVAANPSRCRDKACNAVCRALKKTGGACVNGRCKCNKPVVAEDDAETLVESKKSKCDNQECHQRCRRLKFPGGACLNGRCKCDNFLNEEADPVDEYSESDERRRCKMPKCNRTCTHLGFDSAVCVNHHCNCFNKTQAQAEMSDSSLPVSELSENQNERRCNPRACDLYCRKINKPVGVCVNGHCKCDNFFGTEGDAVNEYSKLDQRRLCNISRCNRTCTRRGYEGGKCVIRSFCKCYNKIQRQDASPLNDVVSDENEESSEILKENEEELTDASFGACKKSTCNQLCQDRGNAGGRCTSNFGHCQCFK